jgi:hypothetical protein
MANDGKTDVIIELTEAERNMLIVLLIEQESKYPDQAYIQMGRRLKQRLHEPRQTVPNPS